MGIEQTLEGELKGIAGVHGDVTYLSIKVMLNMIHIGRDNELEVRTLKDWIQRESSQGRRYPLLHEKLQTYEVHDVRP